MPSHFHLEGVHVTPERKAATCQLDIDERGVL